MIGQHGTDQPAGASAAASRTLKHVNSADWSGYADDGALGRKYAAVRGSWIEPALTCKSAATLVAFWVGLDGYATHTVEQAGTLGYCDGGSAYYYTWWEMYPNSLKVVSSAVRPGDRITASVVRHGAKYTLKVRDPTTPGNNFTRTARCALLTCLDASAEWIAEAPSGSAGEEPLADFGTWKLVHAAVTSGGKRGVISSFPADEITMVSGSTVLARPGSLNAAGNSFTDKWKASRK